MNRGAAAKSVIRKIMLQSNVGLLSHIINSEPMSQSYNKCCGRKGEEAQESNNGRVNEYILGRVVTAI